MTPDRTPATSSARTLLLAALASLLTAGCTGCLVAGYSSRGGAFLWPGGLGLVVVVIMALLLLRRR